MRSYAGAHVHVGARARSAPAFGAERVARGSDPAATGARARSAHCYWSAALHPTNSARRGPSDAQRLGIQHALFLALARVRALLGSRQRKVRSPPLAPRACSTSASVVGSPHRSPLPHPLQGGRQRGHREELRRWRSGPGPGLETL